MLMATLLFFKVNVSSAVIVNVIVQSEAWTLLGGYVIRALLVYKTGFGRILFLAYVLLEIMLYQLLLSQWPVLIYLAVFVDEILKRWKFRYLSDIVV